MQDIMPPNFHRFSEENLKIISHCPVCHSSYNPLEARILAEKDSSHLLYIKCRRCHSGILALITAGAFGLSSVGLITDLDGWEVSAFKDAEAINEDEVLAVHQLLSQGQIGRLWS